MPPTDSLQIFHSASDIRPPARTRELDAGIDLRASEAFTLEPGERKLISTGLHIALPEMTAGLIMPRSGLAAKHGITIVNSPGLVDPSYRGEIKVILLNTDTEQTFVGEKGERIAQLVLMPFLVPVIELVDDIDDLRPSEDERGHGGFGSSGRH
jgi:dUTP pyrophosphatase